MILLDFVLLRNILLHVFIILYETGYLFYIGPITPIFGSGQYWSHLYAAHSICARVSTNYVHMAFLMGEGI